MGADGHFFHDMIEGIIIWEDSDEGAKSAPINTPIEATPESLHHDDAVKAHVDEQPQDVHINDAVHEVVAHDDAGHVDAHHDAATVAAADHSADAHTAADA